MTALLCIASVTAQWDFVKHCPVRLKWILRRTSRIWPHLLQCYLPTHNYNTRPHTFMKLEDISEVGPNCIVMACISPMPLSVNHVYIIRILDRINFNCIDHWDTCRPLALTNKKVHLSLFGICSERHWLTMTLWNSNNRSQCPLLM